MEKIVYKGGKQSFHTNKKMKNDQKLQSTKEQASLYTHKCRQKLNGLSGFGETTLDTKNCISKCYFYFCIEMFWDQQYKCILNTPFHFYRGFSVTMFNLICFLVIY